MSTVCPKCNGDKRLLFYGKSNKRRVYLTCSYCGGTGQMPRCQGASDGECFWQQCPQLRDGEPEKTGRHCPLDNREDDYQ
jgi:hypothetical protein